MKLIFGILLSSISINSFCQIVDIPASERENYRAVEGGSVPVKIDYVTDLNLLIKNLEKPWSTIETGKAYWIGYTDDMYSIAAHKNAAIQPLVNFYQTTKTNAGKVGAIFTLHLIGIDSKIVGRFEENFSNDSARKALLKLTSDTTFLSLIVQLLARDPWKSDLPILVEVLRKHNNRELVNSLFRYTDKIFPFRETIKEDLDTLEVYLNDKNGISRIGTLSVFYRKKSDGEKYYKAENKIVQFNNFESGDVFWRFDVNENNFRVVSEYFPCDLSTFKSGTCDAFKDLIYDLFQLSNEKVSVFSYCDLQDEFHHYVEGNKLIICTLDISRLRWLRFFDDQRH